MSRALATNRIKLFNQGDVMFDDAFTDTDATALVSHVPTEPTAIAWLQEGTEDLVIASDKASSSGVTNVKRCYSVVDHGNQDVKIEISEIVNADTGNNTQEICIRYANKKGYIALRTASFITLGYSLSLVQIENDLLIGSAEHLFEGANTSENDTSLIGLPITDVIIIATSIAVTVTCTVDSKSYSATLTTEAMNNATRSAIKPNASGLTVADFKVTKA